MKRSILVGMLLLCLAACKKDKPQQVITITVSGVAAGGSYELSVIDKKSGSTIIGVKNGQGNYNSQFALDSGEPLLVNYTFTGAGTLDVTIPSKSLFHTSGGYGSVDIKIP